MSVKECYLTEGDIKYKVNDRGPVVGLGYISMEGKAPPPIGTVRYIDGALYYLAYIYSFDTFHAFKKIVPDLQWEPINK